MILLTDPLFILMTSKRCVIIILTSLFSHLWSGPFEVSTKGERFTPNLLTSRDQEGIQSYDPSNCISISGLWIQMLWLKCFFDDHHILFNRALVSSCRSAVRFLNLLTCIFFVHKILISHPSKKYFELWEPVVWSMVGAD